MTRIYIYGPVTTATPPQAVNPQPVQPLAVWQFPDPKNWNPNNHLIECVMPGYSGQQSMFGPPEGTTWGTSAPGGNYAFGSISSLTFPVPITMSMSISIQVSTGIQTSFNTNTQTQNIGLPMVRAGDTQTVTGGVTPAGFRGGGGGGGGESGTSPGGPGGGGAGPHGAGGNATNPTTPGAGDGGQTPAPASGDGVNGTQWDNIHGIGSGAYQGSATVDSHSGGLFGGGSGGTNSLSGRGSGIGGRGLMIITYTPLLKPQGQAQILA